MIYAQREHPRPLTICARAACLAGPRALLLDCPLRWSALTRPRRFGMLMRQLLPGALGEQRARDATRAGGGDMAAKDGSAAKDGTDAAGAGGDGGNGGDGGEGGGGGDDGGEGGGGGGRDHSGAQGVDASASRSAPTVFVARYSVKNFYLAHYDLLQVRSGNIRSGPAL